MSDYNLITSNLPSKFEGRTVPHFPLYGSGENVLIWWWTPILSLSLYITTFRALHNFRLAPADPDFMTAIVTMANLILRI